MTDQMRPIARIEDISKRFGPTVALHPLSIDVHAGEFVTFLGPSGCGKSTTLRILGGFESPDTGRILLDGQDVTGLPPEQRKVNMVFQDYALFPHMTVRKNIAFGLELKRLGRGAIAARIDELAQFLELGALLDRYPDQLSGGQRQRVALCRALAPDPALLLLDEPLGALDAKLRGQVQQELKDIQRRTDKTFFFVTHDQEEAMTMSDRIVVMNEGRVEQDGTPEELYFHPKTRFVAEFVGETNLIDATARGQEGKFVTLDWMGAALRGHAHHDVPEGAEVACSVRLEKIRATSERPEADNAMQARLVSRVFHGNRITAEFALDHASGTHLKVHLDNKTKELPEGDAIWLSWEAEDMAVLAQ